MPPPEGKRSAQSSFGEDSPKRIKRGGEEDPDLDRIRKDLKSDVPQLRLRALRELQELDPALSQDLVVYLLQLPKNCDEASLASVSATLVNLVAGWPLKEDAVLARNFTVVGGVEFLGHCLGFFDSDSEEVKLALTTLSRLAHVVDCREEICASAALLGQVVQLLSSQWKKRSRKLVSQLIPEGASELVKAGATGKLLHNLSEPADWVVAARLIKHSGEPLLNIGNTLIRRLREALDGGEAEQTGALYLLFALEDNPRSRLRLRSPDIIQRLFGLLETPRDRLKRKALACILHIVVENDHFKHQLELIDHVLPLLQSPNPKVLSGALSIVAELANHEEHRQAIAASAHIPLLNHLLISDSLEVLDLALCVVQKLAPLEDYRGHESTAATVPHLLRFLKANDPPDGQHQYLALQVLHMLVSGNESKSLGDIKQLIASNGGIEMALDVVIQTDMSLRNKRAALSLIANLCHSNEPNRMKMLDADGVNILLEILRDARIENLRQSAAAALWSLSYCKQTVQPLLQANGLQPLIELLSCSVKKTQGFALGCLRNLSHDNRCKLAIVGMKGLSALVRLMDNPLEKVKEATIGTLWNLSSTPKNDSAFIRELSVPSMVRLVSNSNNPKVLIGIINILSNLLSIKDSPIFQPLLYSFLQEGGLLAFGLHRVLRANTDPQLSPAEKADDDAEKIRSKLEQLRRRALEHKDMIYVILNSEHVGYRAAAAMTIAVNIPSFADISTLRAEGTLDRIFSAFKAALTLAGETHSYLLTSNLILSLQALFKFVNATVPPEQIVYKTNFADLFGSQKFSDVQFLVEDRTFYAHKLILADYREGNGSNYFEKMFTNEMVESSSKAIVIPDKGVEVFRKVLQSCYVGKVHLSSVDEAIQVLLAADQYMLPKLRRQCEVYIASHMGVENFEELLRFANQYHFSELKRACVEWLLDNADSIFLDSRQAPDLPAGSLDSALAFVEKRILKNFPPAVNTEDWTLIADPID